MNILSILKSKDGKAIKENFISLSILQLVTMFLPLITLPYIIRVVGYEKFGMIALSASVIAYFNSIVDYSFMVTGVRDVSINRKKNKRLNLIFSKVITVKLILLLVAFCAIMLIITLYPPFYSEKKLFIYTALSLIGVAIFPAWFFQGMEEMKYISMIKLSITVIYTICIFALIKEESDYYLIPLMASLGSIISGVLGLYYLHSRYKVKFMFCNYKIFKKTIVYNFPVFVNQFIPNLYNNSTSLILGVIVSSSALGIYSALRRVIDLVVVLVNIVSRVFFPFINRNKNSFKAYQSLMFFMILVMLSILIITKDLVFIYLNMSGSIALSSYIIMCTSLIGYVAYDIYGLNYFIVNKKDKYVMFNTIFCSLLAFVVSIPLINYYGVIGASLTLLIGRFMMGFSLMFKYFKVRDV